jgi:hypothetical protein
MRTVIAWLVTPRWLSRRLSLSPKTPGAITIITTTAKTATTDATREAVMITTTMDIEWLEHKKAWKDVQTIIRCKRMKGDTTTQKDH